MEELVFLDKGSVNDVPFTTSEVIAAYAGISHHAVQQIIGQHEGDIKEFGALAFEMREVSKNGGTNYAKICHLNEEQATLLITYLKNTAPVVAFKKALVHQFYAMKTELFKRRSEREFIKPVRRDVTDRIQDCIPESPHKSRVYGNYMNLCYKTAIGKCASQIRKERGAPKKAVAADFLTADELRVVSRMLERIAMLLEMGFDYQKIKETLETAPALARRIA